MKSRPIGAGQNILATQNNDRRDDARGGSFLLPHQQLGALALGTEPTNGQLVPIVINGTTITVTAVTAIGSTANNVLIGGSALAFVTNLVNFLRRPDLTTSTQIAASSANQQLLAYVGWAWPGSGTTIVPFSLNKNVNGITGGLTSFNITGITVTSGTWTAQTMQLYVEDGTYFIGNTRYLFLGASTPTVTAPSSHPRIDLLTIDSSGTLAWTTGTEASSPVAPSYPSGKVPICELYNVVSETALYDNENQQSGEGYTSNDVRPVINQLGGSGTIDGAWFTDLAGIPSGAGVIPTANVPQNSFNSQTFTAATAVTKGQALIMGNGVSRYLNANQTGKGQNWQLLNAGNPYLGQTFTTSANCRSLSQFTIWVNDTFGVGEQITWWIYATSGGTPTGTALATGTFTAPYSNPSAITITPNLVLSPSTVYAIVLKDTGSSQNATYIYGNTGAGLAGGSLIYSSNGSSWTTNSGESLYLIEYEIITVAGEVQPSDTTQTVYSADAYDLADNFCGFALSTVSANASVGVNLGPVDADQSGLTPGSEYYLNGSAGAIGTTAGSVSVKVGIAMSATQLLIKFENHP
ncbi:MAG TPA: hypothetical protein VGL53_21565 [Bryobacteraceae bacterium]|jgi:hypothetical protein